MVLHVVTCTGSLLLTGLFAVAFLGQALIGCSSIVVSFHVAELGCMLMNGHPQTHSVLLHYDVSDM